MTRKALVIPEFDSGLAGRPGAWYAPLMFRIWVNGTHWADPSGRTEFPMDEADQLSLNLAFRGIRCLVAPVNWNGAMT